MPRYALDGSLDFAFEADGDEDARVKTDRIAQLMVDAVREEILVEQSALQIRSTRMGPRVKPLSILDLDRPGL